MIETSQTNSGSAVPRTNPKDWVGVDAEDIPLGWIDDMTRRLFNIANRNLIRLETAQMKINDLGLTAEQIMKNTAQHARLAAQIRTEVERLKKLELKRPSRKSKVTVNDDQLRAELQREIDRIIAAETAAEDPAETAF